MLKTLRGESSGGQQQTGSARGRIDLNQLSRRGLWPRPSSGLGGLGGWSGAWRSRLASWINRAASGRSCTDCRFVPNNPLFQLSDFAADQATDRTTERY